MKNTIFCLLAMVLLLACTKQSVEPPLPPHLLEKQDQLLTLVNGHQTQKNWYYDDQLIQYHTGEEAKEGMSYPQAIQCGDSMGIDTDFLGNKIFATVAMVSNLYFYQTGFVDTTVLSWDLNPGLLNDFNQFQAPFPENIRGILFFRFRAGQILELKMSPALGSNDIIDTYTISKIEPLAGRLGLFVSNGSFEFLFGYLTRHGDYLYLDVGLAVMVLELFIDDYRLSGGNDLQGIPCCAHPCLPWVLGSGNPIAESWCLDMDRYCLDFPDQCN